VSVLLMQVFFIDLRLDCSGDQCFSFKELFSFRSRSCEPTVKPFLSQTNQKVNLSTHFNDGDSN